MLSRHQAILSFYAVARSEPVGKPLARCVRVPVLLTLDSSADPRTLRRDGLAALRQSRIIRLTREAIEQGAELRHEDLTRILTTSPSTIKRDIARLVAHGLDVRTRGRR